MSTANDVLFFGFGEAMHREVIDAELIDDPFLVYFAGTIRCGSIRQQDGCRTSMFAHSWGSLREHAYGD